MPPPCQGDAPFVISADVVVPMAGDTVYYNGGVVVERNRIAAVGPLHALRTQFGDLPHDHVAGLMLPGLVNAHTHLELTHLRGQLPAGHFVDWVKSLLQFNQSQADTDANAIAAVEDGMAESLRCGVTAVGDITKRVASSRGVLRQGPIRAISFGELTGIGARRTNLAERLASCADITSASETMAIGLSPHAPYTVEGPALQQILEKSAAGRLPLAMHLAELAEESEFLRSLGGRLREAWDLGGTAHAILDNQIPLFNGGPIRWADHYGLLSASERVPLVLAHVNYCDDAELAVLANSKCSVAYCPRTRQFFGHDAVTPHRYREMLDAGINVCLGTDSLASNPDLSILREAQLLWRRDRISALLAMEMITWRGARALGIQAGRLAAGNWADITIMPIEAIPGESAEALLGRLLGDSPAARAVWVGGRRVV